MEKQPYEDRSLAFGRAACRLDRTCFAGIGGRRRKKGLSLADGHQAGLAQRPRTQCDDEGEALFPPPSIMAALQRVASERIHGPRFSSLFLRMSFSQKGPLLGDMP